MQSLAVSSFLASFVLVGCLGIRGQDDTAKTDPAAGNQSALGIDDAGKFVESWCGSGTLTNVRKLDAEDYLVSAEMPSWLNIASEVNRVWKTEFRSQEEFIKDLKSEPILKAMFPSGKMVLADFSSGSGCRDTLVAIDVLAAAYLKKLKDASSANALTCERASQEDNHRLVIRAPAIGAVRGAYYTDVESFTGCNTTLAEVLVGHASTGTLTVSSVSHAGTQTGDIPLYDFDLMSYILEADGSAQLLRSDGALKFFYSRLSGHRRQR